MKQIINYVLANSLTRLGAHLVLEQLFKHTYIVSYFNEFSPLSFGNESMNNITQFVSAIVLGSFRNHSVIKQ